MQTDFFQVLNYVVVVEVSKKDLKLSDRIYKCECGNVIDRDFQAALNLKRYGENALKESVA